MRLKKEGIIELEKRRRIRQGEDKNGEKKER